LIQIAAWLPMSTISSAIAACSIVVSRVRQLSYHATSSLAAAAFSVEAPASSSAFRKAPSCKAMAELRFANLKAGR
jgi:hypothetical protein